MVYKADFHIHTVLSPCGDLEMSPKAIIKTAKDRGINIIGITDHNSTRNALACREIGEKDGVFVLMGAEVQTIEEVHCLCFMPDIVSLKIFQDFLDANIIKIPNSIDKFGYQLVVDENENIIEEVHYFLLNSLKIGIEELSKKVYDLNGIFIPAHVDRPFNSISSQLGFIPEDLNFHILELSAYAQRNKFIKENKFFDSYHYICSSDSHFLRDIGKVYTEINLLDLGFENIKKSLIENKVKPIFCENDRFTYY